jgi:hypothetical protein
METLRIDTGQSFLPLPVSLPATSEIKPLYKPKSFIEANTIEVSLNHLRNACVIPVYAKDNERTIAHQEFIEVAQESLYRAFPQQSFDEPEIRVSHQIKGRTPEAIHKNAKDLLDSEKTIYYERCAFIIRIPRLMTTIDGNEIALTIGGVRSYHMDNLYGRKTYEKFKFFIGFQNKVCCNLCVSTDGFAEEIKSSSLVELQKQILEVIQRYNAEKHLVEMQNLAGDYLTEHQFALLAGRTRLYQSLPKREQKQIPPLMLNDGQLNAIIRDYYSDNSFCRDSNGDINLWRTYNLFTGANKSSYIDAFLDRNVNAFDFIQGIQRALSGNSPYHWFLS